MSKTAWMLRRGGDAFPVMHHFYVMGDHDLSSEAEVSAFLITTESGDIDTAKYILDAWMAILIENNVPYDGEESEIESAIEDCIKQIPYSFQYPLSITELIKIHREMNLYDNVGSLYDFLDEEVRPNLRSLSDKIKLSLNEQFCRSRFGGQYNTYIGNKELWFRISSTGYNWVNDIYIWTADHYRPLGAQTITICRDYESDNGDKEGLPEYFYKAKDGAVYKDMPILEFLAEDHDTRPIFDTTIIASGVDHSYMVKQEKDLMCVSELSANVLNDYKTRTQTRLIQMCNEIKRNHPELSEVDIIEINPRENRNGKMIASEVVFYCSSDVDELDGLKVSIILNRGISDTTVKDVARKFRIEYNDYLKFKGIEV